MIAKGVLGIARAHAMTGSKALLKISVGYVLFQ